MLPSRAISGLALAVLTASFGTSAANISLPALVDSFDSRPSEVQWVVVAYLLGMTAASVTVGALGDRVGRRRALRAGTLLFLVAAVVSATATTLPVLVLARAVQGVAAAIMTALPIALARDLTADGRTGRAMGLLGTTSAVGTALGPAAGGILVEWGGWMAPFWAMLPLGALALMMLVPRDLLVADASDRPRRPFDGIGATLLSAGIAAYALALAAPTPGWPVLPLLGVAAALLAATVMAERRAASPVLPLAELRSGPVVAGVIGNLLVAAVMMTTLVVGPFALHDGLGLPVAVAGLVMTVGPVTAAISGVVAGRVVDRPSSPALTTCALALVTVGAVGLALLPGGWGVPGYIAALIVLTPGYQLFLAATNTRVLSGAAPVRRGAVAGVLALARNLGLVTGASAMGSLFLALRGSEAAPSAVLDAMRATFLVAAVLAAVATAASVVLARSAGPTAPRPPVTRRERPARSRTRR